MNNYTTQILGSIHSCSDGDRETTLTSYDLQTQKKAYNAPSAISPYF